MNAGELCETLRGFHPKQKMEFVGNVYDSIVRRDVAHFSRDTCIGITESDECVSIMCMGNHSIIGMLFWEIPNVGKLLKAMKNIDKKKTVCLFFSGRDEMSGLFADDTIMTDFNVSGIKGYGNVIFSGRFIAETVR